MLFLSPRPPENDYAEFYGLGQGNLSSHLDPNFYLEYEESNEAKYLEILSQIARVVTPADSDVRISILDVGCSAGLFVKLANDLGYDCTGLEPSHEASAVALTRRNVRVINSTIESAELAEASFDVVHSHHVIEHLYHPGRDLETMTKWLKPGGLMIVEVPNEIRNVARLRRYTSLSIDAPQTVESIHHTSFFDCHSLRHLFSQAKLEQISVRAPYSVRFAWYKFPLQFVSFLLSRSLGGGMALIASGRKPYA